MYVYELALELDKKSGEVATIATSLGITGLGPSSSLTREQVAQLRSAVLGRPLAEVGEPAPAAGAEVPPPPTLGAKAGRHLSRVVVAAAVATATAAFCFMAMNSGPDEARKQRIEAEAANADDAPPTTFGAGAPAEEPVDGHAVLAQLPPAEALAPLAAGKDGRWVASPDDTVADAGSGEDLGGACLPGNNPQTVIYRQYALDGERGLHGAASVNVRAFANATQAKAWVAAEAGVLDCDLDRAREQLLAEVPGSTIVEDGIASIPPVDGGIAHRYTATYEVGGASCVRYEDVYRNAVGRYSTSVLLITCGTEFDRSAEQRFIHDLLARLAAPPPT